MTYQMRQRDAELIGEQRGILIGEKRGEMRGKLLGKQERDRQIVSNMLAAGMNIDAIIDITGLTASEIDLLKKQ